MNEKLMNYWIPPTVSNNIYKISSFRTPDAGRLISPLKYLNNNQRLPTAESDYQTPLKNPKTYGNNNFLIEIFA